MPQANGKKPYLTGNTFQLWLRTRSRLPNVCPKHQRGRILSDAACCSDGAALIQRCFSVQACNQALHLTQSSQRLLAPLLEEFALRRFEGSLQAYLALVERKGVAKASLNLGTVCISLCEPVALMGNRPLDEIDHLLQALRLQLGTQVAAVN